jgi:hypothetical protein
MPHYPTGAEALLVCLATPSPRGPLGIPVLLWGRPGVGKSSFIEGLATEALGVTTLIASIHDPTDFSGLPVLEEGEVRYAVPHWARQLEKSADSILFLDELSTAPPSVQSALLRVVFERRVGQFALPDTVRIVAAANPPDLMVGGWELSPPLRNRFVHLQWDIPATAYLASLTDGWPTASLPTVDREHHERRVTDFRIRIGGFLQLRPDALHGSAEENPFGFPSPRSWDFVAALLATADLLGYRVGGEDQRIVLDLVAGCLGEATALPFVEYLTNLRLPDPLAVLRGEEAVQVTELNDAEVYVLFRSLNHHLAKELGGGGALVPYSLEYLKLTDRLFADGRRDLVFVPLRELAQRGWLLELTTAAREGGQSATVLAALNTVLSDADFAEFVDVLT